MLSCCSAAGEIMPPYIVYKAKKLWKPWLIGGPAGTRYVTSSSGWMETDQFYEWFKAMFVPRVESLPGHKMLIFDGHASHVNLKVVQLALEKNICIICLPPHSSHCLQPLDKGKIIDKLPVRYKKLNLISMSVI